MEHKEFFKEILLTFRQLFSGIYPTIENEGSPLFKKKVPTLSDDRRNLRRDREIVSEDLMKALEEKNAELFHQ